VFNLCDGFVVLVVVQFGLDLEGTSVGKQEEVVDFSCNWRGSYCLL
jgi:hypothetical protein